MGRIVFSAPSTVAPVYRLVKYSKCNKYLINKCLIVRLNAAHHIGHRQQSPGVGGQSVRNSNLRVVIPAPMNSGMQTNDEMSYNEVCLPFGIPYERYLQTKNLISSYSPQHRQQTSLNTPVVALQTPNLAYSNLGSFGPQDFSMNSADVMGISNWNHTNISTVQHTR